MDEGGGEVGGSGREKWKGSRREVEETCKSNQREVREERSSK